MLEDEITERERKEFEVKHGEVGF